MRVVEAAGSIVPTEPASQRPCPAGAANGLVTSLFHDDFGGNGAVRISAAGRMEDQRG
jgi:hypothetical protein